MFVFWWFCVNFSVCFVSVIVCLLFVCNIGFVVLNKSCICFFLEFVCLSKSFKEFFWVDCVVFMIVDKSNDSVKKDWIVFLLFICFVLCIIFGFVNFVKFVVLKFSVIVGLG